MNLPLKRFWNALVNFRGIMRIIGVEINKARMVLSESELSKKETKMGTPFLSEGLLPLSHKWYDFQGAKMLENTFIHVPGLGIKSDQRIWSSDIYSWDDLSCKGFNCFSPNKREILKCCIEESAEHLSRGNP